MANTVQISNKILDWVSSVVSLNDTFRVTLESWRSGEKQPTFNQLEEFSNKTHIPIGYFFLNSPPMENLEIVKFRTVDSLCLQNPSRDLIDTVRQMENVQEWMRENVIASKGEKVPFLGALNTNVDVMSISYAVRKVLSLSITWFEQSKSVEESFKYIRQAISNAGVIVMMNGIVGSNTHRALRVDEFRAFTLIDDYAPLIFINSADVKAAMLFSLLHEFVHIGLGKSSLFNAGISDENYINPYEVVCNAVAAEILVPIEVFVNLWKKTYRTHEIEENIRSVAGYFKCSQSVIARRALDSGFITKDVYYRFISQTVVSRKPVSSGGDYYKTQSTRIDKKFLLSLNTSIQEGKTLHTEAFRLTNTNRTTFDGVVREVQGERK